tara:strand:+ start:35 stop:1225 length:1191 start_codon:yes stop_codon:yes gene_type:complete
LNKIPIARTNLTEEEIQSVLEPLRSGWLVQGPKVKEFEEIWSDFTGSKESIAVTSCTAGLYLSLAAIGFGPGDEAIVPAFTWISTANVVEHLGGKVIFADIDLKSFNIDVASIEKLITKRTKVILPVHLFGLAAEMDRIIKIAKTYKLSIIEDAACGFGSKINGKHTGTFGDTGCFSFHPRKAITTGEGGMITTSDADLAKKIRCLRDHGAMISDLQRHLGPKPFLLADHPEAGHNFRMTDLQGALGAKQMQRSKKIITERKNIAQKYNEAFKNINWIQTPFVPNNYEHGYQSYPCLLNPDLFYEKNKNNLYKNISITNKKRNKFMEMLLDLGISTRPATHAVHMLSYYKKKYKLDPQDFPNAYIANECSISFPLFHGMSSTEQDYVIEKVSNLNL